jgi:hypothetical protein
VEPKHIYIREFPALFHASWYKTAVRDVAHVWRRDRDLHRGGRRRGRAAAGLIRECRTKPIRTCRVADKHGEPPLDEQG